MRASQGLIDCPHANKRISRNHSETMRKEIQTERQRYKDRDRDRDRDVGGDRDRHCIYSEAQREFTSRNSSFTPALQKPPPMINSPGIPCPQTRLPPQCLQKHQKNNIPPPVSIPPLQPTTAPSSSSPSRS